MFLLQLACESREPLRNSTIDIFYEKIRLRKLIPLTRLQNLIAQQKLEPGKVLCRGRPSMLSEHSEQTKSDTSNFSLNADILDPMQMGMRETRTDVYHINNWFSH